MTISEANHKIVFVRKVIGPVKKFETKMENSKANHKIVVAESSQVPLKSLKQNDNK